MDFGATAEAATGQWGNGKNPPNYFMLMKQRFELDNPAIRVRAVPQHIAGFIDDLFLDSSITKPVGDLYVGTHAQSEGFLFIRLFDRQVDVEGNPADDITDFEILNQTGAPKIHDSLVGYQRATPPASDPAPTHSFNIKGCNIGRDRFFPKAGKPVAPFLVRMKQSFGNNVIVTAPKHFHGLIDDKLHQSIFEYMAHEWVVRAKAVKAESGFKGTKIDGYRGFKNRDELIAAYKLAKLPFYDGSLVPDTLWDSLVPKTADFKEHRKLSKTLQLARTLEKVSELPVNRQFRIEIERVRWTFAAGVKIPTTPADRMNLLRNDLLADSRFDANNPWPLYERRGYPDIDAYIAGHDWAFPARPSDTDPNIVIGRHFDYTLVEPITDRSVAAPTPQPLIYNFYPGSGSPHSAILTALVETDGRFFGRV